MKSLQQTSLLVIRRLLAGQPTSAAKVTFAWQYVAGAPLSRHGTLDWREDGTLRVRATSVTWGRELRANRDVLLERLHEVLGRGVVTRLVIEGAEERRREPAPSEPPDRTQE